MLQDLSYGKLQNEYISRTAEANDVVVCFSGRDVVICRHEDDTLTLPRYSEVLSWQEGADSGEGDYCYAFSMQGTNYFLYLGADVRIGDTRYRLESCSALRQLVSKEICFAVMTALHLYSWYTRHRYCGRCGTKTVHDSKERMLSCPHCGNMAYPVICPAVIVAVTDGDRLLLTKYAGRNYSRYALIAGYTEIGETLEQSVDREVMEEVGLKVKNLRYYKSQPWGVDGNILMGFFCDLDGDDTIDLDPDELSVAEWHMRDSLPAHDDGISLTREMIRVFEEAKEPR